MPKERINFILRQEKSSFNEYFFKNPSIRNIQVFLYPALNLYFRYNLVPVYFNNYSDFK